MLLARTGLRCSCVPRFTCPLSGGNEAFDIIAGIAEKNRLFKENERLMAARTQHTTRHGVDMQGAFSFGASAIQGLRPSMEDTSLHLTELPGAPSHALFGVFDGHGGTAAAEFAAARVGGALVDAGLGGAADDGEALALAIAAIDAELVKADEKSGCCALLALLCMRSRHLTVASVGDSRAVLGRQGGAVAPLVLSPPSEHNPGDAVERARIERAGGSVANVPFTSGAGEGESVGAINRVNGGLAVARALGDAPYKNDATLPADAQLVVSTPHIMRHTIQTTAGDEFLLLACDGVWDVMSSEEAAAVVRRELRLANRQCLRVLAENFGSTRLRVEVLRSKDVSKYSVGEYWDFPRTRYKSTSGFVMKVLADDGSGAGPGELHLRETPPAMWEGGWEATADNPVAKSSLARAWPCSIVCEKLVDKCLERGSSDNLSAVLVLFPDAEVGLAGHDGSTMDDMLLGRGTTDAEKQKWVNCDELKSSV